MSKRILHALCVSILAFQAHSQTAPAVGEQKAELHPEKMTKRLLGYELGQRGANHREWLKIEEQTAPDGTLEVVTNAAYVELATGMHYRDAQGRWQETIEEFSVVPGWAVAHKGPHKVSLAYNLNTAGPVGVQMSDGRIMRSQVLALYYLDSSTQKSVRLAEVKDCAGKVLPPNQVIYEDAFVGLRADVRFTYTKAGIEQDVILREQPPAPEEFGLHSNTTELAVLTEFIDPPAAKITQKTVQARRKASSTKAGEDQDIDFGPMWIGRGKAFSEGSDTADRPHQNRVQVLKKWMELNGRRFLMEKVSVPQVRKELSKLPRQAGVLPKNPTTQYAELEVPKPRTGKPSTEQLEVAQVSSSAPGYVLDYLQLNSTIANYTLRGDTTYYISGNVYASGDLTIEGGTVIKYDSDSSLIYYGDYWLGDDVYSKTGPYRPATFTSKDDNSIGEVISGSSGAPAILNSTFLSTPYPEVPLSYLNMRYAGVGYSGGGEPHYLNNCTFVNCGSGVEMQFGGIDLYNVLFAGCSNAIYYAAVGSNIYGTDVFWIGAHNVTVDQGTFLSVNEWPEVTAGATVQLMSCLFSRLSQYVWMQLLDYGYTSEATYEVSASPFISAGAGNYYLPENSPYRNVGSTNSYALPYLKTKTTYPPVVYSNVTYTTDLVLTPQASRDTDAPDVGYHYDPIDYITDNVVITNASLTLTNGVVVACQDNPGLALWSGTGLKSIATATTPNWFTRYNCVQEQPVKIGTSSGSSVYAFQSPNMTASFRSTKFSAMAGAGGYQLYNANSHRITNMFVRDCEFYGGSSIYLIGLTNTGVWFDNNLLFRTPFYAFLSSGTSSLGFSNNLCYGSTLRPGSGASSNLWFFYNNAFDQCLFSPIITNQITMNGYNAYINTTNSLNPTNASNQVLTSFAYQSGPLGSFYQPTNSSLINVGSTNANLVGLYHYTAAINRLKETNTVVDIGYHYVATDANGVPTDTDGDGLPDYWEDWNGNGTADGGETSWLTSSNGTTGVTGLKVYTPLK